MNKKIRIDVFHDVICGWCYVFSPRLRQIAQEFSVDIHHHAFALSPTKQDVIERFGSSEQAKREILGHWEHCAKADDLKRINVDGMRKQKFDYPISTPGLIACKSAAQQGGEDVYWNYFDAVTHAHLHENRNIGDWNVLADIAQEIGLDIDRFKQDVASPLRHDEIKSDRKLAQTYGVNSTPTMVVNKQWAVPGAISLAQLREVFEEIQESI